MTKKNDGGPAFANGDWCPGMSLRDYFAGQALAGMLSRPHADGSDFLHDTGPGVAAEWAYMFADAMLKERDQ